MEVLQSCLPYLPTLNDSYHPVSPLSIVASVAAVVLVAAVIVIVAKTILFNESGHPPQ